MTKKKLSEIDEAYRCGKCGICIQVCPVFNDSLNEIRSPRAKVQLIRSFAENRLDSSFRLKDVVDRCLMCGGCTDICPSGVDNESLFMRMRSSMVSEYGEDWKKKIMFHFLTHEDQLKVASRFAAFGRNFVLDKVIKDVKLGNMQVSNLPKFNKKPFRDQIPPISKPKPDKRERGRVLYFTGCATNQVYDEVGHATVRVLNKLGYQVEIPKDQVCCSLAMFLKGSLEQSKENILKNIEIFCQDYVDAVIVDCATCGSALRHSYPKVLKELGLPTDRAMKLTARIKDVSEFVLESMDDAKLQFQEDSAKTKVTYHSPCHLRNSQGVKTEVQDLLKRLPNVDFHQAGDEESCCGGGGTFCYDFPDISKRIVDKKVANADSTGATHWASGCPGCRINLGGNLEKDSKLKMIHPIQLVLEALESKE